jgi:hypothetical protein
MNFVKKKKIFLIIIKTSSIIIDMTVMIIWLNQLCIIKKFKFLKYCHLINKKPLNTHLISLMKKMIILNPSKMIKNSPVAKLIIFSCLNMLNKTL